MGLVKKSGKKACIIIVHNMQKIKVCSLTRSHVSLSNKTSFVSLVSAPRWCCAQDCRELPRPLHWREGIWLQGILIPQVRPETIYRFFALSLNHVQLLLKLLFIPWWKCFTFNHLSGLRQWCWYPYADRIQRAVSKSLLWFDTKWANEKHSGSGV